MEHELVVKDYMTSLGYKPWTGEEVKTSVMKSDLYSGYVEYCNRYNLKYESSKLFDFSIEDAGFRICMNSRGGYIPVTSYESGIVADGYKAYRFIITRYYMASLGYKPWVDGKAKLQIGKAELYDGYIQYRNNLGLKPETNKFFSWAIEYLGFETCRDAQGYYIPVMEYVMDEITGIITYPHFNLAESFMNSMGYKPRLESSNGTLIPRDVLYNGYAYYCSQLKQRCVSRMQFSRGIEKLGFTVCRNSKGYYIPVVELVLSGHMCFNLAESYMDSLGFKPRTGSSNGTPILRNSLYNGYVYYCIQLKQKCASKIQFSSDIEKLGFTICRNSHGYYIPVQK